MNMQSRLEALIQKWRAEAPRWPPEQFDGDVFAQCADELEAALATTREDGDCPLGPHHAHGWTLDDGNQCEWCMQLKSEVARQNQAAGVPRVAPQKEHK